MNSRLLTPDWIRSWLLQNKQLLLRLLIVIGVLLISAALPAMVSQQSVTLLLVLLCGTGAVLLFLYRPHLGLLALIPASLLVPFEIGTGSSTGLHAGVLLLSLLIGLWVLEMIAHQHKVLLAWSRPILPLLIFLVIAVLAFLTGQLPWFSLASAPIRAQVAGLAIFLLSGGAFLLVAHQIRDIHWLKWLTWIFLALGALYIIGRLAPGLGRFTHRLFQNGVFNQSLFWTWLVALASSQAVFNQRLRPAWRLVLSGLVMATFYVSLGQARSWASGWLPPLVAMVVILGAAAPRLGLVTILGLGSMLAPKAHDIINLVTVEVSSEFALTARLEAYRIVLEIARVSPILGLGPANYYGYTPLLPLLGWHVQFNSHSQYVDLMAQTGLLGLACFLWFTWEVGRLGWQLRTQVPGGFAQAYVYGALGGLAGMLVAGMLGDWVLPFVYNVGIVGFRSSVLGWLFLGALVFLEHQFGPAKRAIDEEA